MTPRASATWEHVNDIHSALNPTHMWVNRPTNADAVQQVVVQALQESKRISLAGGRHAMGGQQFVHEGELLDLRGLDRIVSLDMERGLVRAEAGITWPKLIQGILELQRQRAPDQPPRWSIAQKQTGADELTLGGALAANIHGRGLTMGPIVDDIETFTIINAQGQRLSCSRLQNAELFSLAIGGYGLFGVIVDVTLRLVRRRTLRRVVRILDIEEAISAAERRIRDGFLYGDFQFDIDPASPSFLTKGVFSSYCPVEGDPLPPESQRSLSKENWLNLLTLAHTDKSRAFTLYAQHYLATDGQLYMTDTHQLSEYLDGYHTHVDQHTCAVHPGSEMITELYVPPARLIEFLHAAAKLLSNRQSPVIYGTIRLIEPDTQTVMAWANQRYACIIFNLHIDHTPSAIAHGAESFRLLIDLAASLGGSYYLTYHRYATPQQLERCYPRARDFFASKLRHDPAEVFQSDWYRHYAPHFKGAAS
jgi:FAD/FMN-containing dehydrogenase